MNRAVFQENNMMSFCYEHNTYTYNYTYVYNFDQNTVSEINTGILERSDSVLSSASTVDM
jgi:hypothetical protein